jgi:peptidoglycan L-alanyl-D-glutamate endopeptidase CwlK
MHKFKLSTSSLRNIEGVDPELIEIAKLAIQITTVDFGYGKGAGLRTAEYQNELFRDGASKKDGYERRSAHQDGLAVDFYAYVGGRASYEHHHLAMVAAAHLQAASMLCVEVEWGGLWIPKNPELINGIIYGWDMPHIQKVKQ